MLRKLCVKNLFLDHIKLLNVGLLQTRFYSDNIVNVKTINNWILSFIKDLLI